MNPKFLKLSTVVLLLIFIGTSCQKDEFEYADESIIISNHPGVFVYKTSFDYLDKVWIQVTPDGNLNRILSLTTDDNNLVIDKEGNITPKYRHLLKSGYIVGDAHEWAAYTDISFTEYLDYNEKNNVNSWPMELIELRIVDKNPYEELYWMGCLNCSIKEFTLGQINEMIEKGTLEEHFTRIK